MSGINLLKKKEIETVEQVKLRRLLYIVGVGFLSLSFLISLILLIISVKLRDQARDLVSIEDSWNEKIKSLNDVEVYNSVLKQKLDTLKKLKKGVDYYAYISMIQTLIPEDINIVDLKMDNNGEIDFNGQANSSTSLINFLDGLAGSAEGKIQSITLKSLILSRDTSYRFQLSLKVPKGK